jgi:hypothetical protein
MRAPTVLAVLLLVGCGAYGQRAQPSPAELRMMAYLTRDPYVVIERTERDGDDHLVVITRQGNVTRRYLIAPDDPTRNDLRLRRLEDECTLDTAPNDQPGGGPPPRGR